MSQRRSIITGLALGFGLIVLGGCGDLNEPVDDPPDQEPPPAGPCYVEQDPVLLITLATDADGQSLSTIELSELTFNGEPMANAVYDYHSNLTVIEEIGQEQQEEIEDSDWFYECQLPCAFGSRNGTYGFVATAPGHDPKTVVVDAEYGTDRGGCPRYIGDGTEIEINF